MKTVYLCPCKKCIEYPRRYRSEVTIGVLPCILSALHYYRTCSVKRAAKHHLLNSRSNHVRHATLSTLLSVLCSCLETTLLRRNTRPSFLHKISSKDKIVHSQIPATTCTLPTPESSAKFKTIPRFHTQRSRRTRYTK